MPEVNFIKLIFLCFKKNQSKIRPSHIFISNLSYPNKKEDLGGWKMPELCNSEFKCFLKAGALGK